jgi:hypothetical protein
MGPLGFEQVDEDFYKVYFRDVEIGEFGAEALRFRPVQVMRRMDVGSQFPTRRFLDISNSAISPSHWFRT